MIHFSFFLTCSYLNHFFRANSRNASKLEAQPYLRVTAMREIAVFHFGSCAGVVGMKGYEMTDV